LSSTSASATASAGARPKHWAIDFVLLAAIWGSSFLFMRIGTVEFGPLPTAAVRVAVLALPAHPLLRTPEALAVVGPRAFGYDVDYVPLEAIF